MIIIAGGEPELCHRRHAKREGGVYAPPYALRVRKSCPECSVHVLCLCRSVKRGLCEIPGEKNWRTWNPRMHGDTDKEAQVWRGSLVSLSFQPRSSLRGCLCFSLSHRRRSQSCSYLDYALHCSRVGHECGIAAWQRGHVQRISITWMGRTWSVGRLIGRSVGRSMHVVP